MPSLLDGQVLDLFGSVVANEPPFSVRLRSRIGSQLGDERVGGVVMMDSNGCIVRTTFYTRMTSKSADSGKTRIFSR